MIDEENPTTTANLITQTINEPKNTKFLEQCYFIYELEEEKKLATNILKILNDEELIKKIRHLEAITEENENQIYYYEEEQHNIKKLQYKKELEKKIRTIRNEQIKNLANIMKKIIKEEKIDL